MAKANRRGKQASVAGDNLSSSSSSSMATTQVPSEDEKRQPQQQPEQQNRQHYEKRVRYLEEENRAYQKEVEALKTKLANVSITPSDSMRKLKEGYLQKLNVLEEQVEELKKKQDVQSQLSTYRRKNDQGVKAMQDEIQKLKAQKVQLRCKLKLESVQYRLCKATLEKEILQLQKEGRKNQYEICRLFAVNQRQKLVLKRKTEEAYRLKQLVEFREASLNGKTGSKSRAGLQAIKHKLEVTSQINQICSEYEHQLQLLTDEVGKVNQEAEMLKQENIRLMLQAKELECREDPDLKDLKEDMLRLSSLLRQLEMSSAKPMHPEQSQEESSQASLSIGSTTLKSETSTSEAGNSRHFIASDERKAAGTCCSCSKRSLCKTMKCECRAAGDSCGISCGCSQSKCTNREDDAVKADTSVQIETVAANLTVGGTELNNIAYSNDATQLETQSLLVSEPAPPQAQNIPESLPPEADDHCGLKKMPLYDIANTLVKSFTGKNNQRKKGRN